MKGWLALPWLLAGGCLVSCGPLYWRLHGSDPVSATVVDSKSGAPVSGAAVEVIWEIERPDFLHGHDHEYLAQSAITAPDGTFTVPGWGPKLINGHVAADYPRVTITWNGVSTRHSNHWGGMRAGTVCNGQFTTETDEWWHDSVTLNVTWNHCDLAAYPDEASRAAAGRVAAIEELMPFGRGTYPDPKSGYLGLFSSFTMARRIAETREESDMVRDAFCERLIAQFERMSEADQHDLPRFHGGSPSKPIDHDSDVVPFCAEPDPAPSEATLTGTAR